MDAKVIGILSGVSYVSGVDYYKGINEEFGSLVGTGTGLMPKNPLMTMVSVDCDAYARLLCDKKWEAVAKYLMVGIDKLVASGIDCIGLASNTAHICYPFVKEKYPDVDILHIADCTARAIKSHGITTVGLLGTEPTMRERYLKDRLSLHGITAIVPESDESLTKIFNFIMKELGANVFLDSTRDFFVSEALKLQDRGCKGLILGCTEIELLIKQEHVPELKVFPSAELHIKSLASIAADKASVSDFLPVEE
eukprot:TRINITY_DN20068_c0_g1_i1.p1 TRINITY_DN20068_c0_g1~~TRINITY_DN20068_c0_g1_i1.p1  ORF type:complete len:252 (+),score=51.96 TRINITY_DN20068_c0_g1_i1:61-816(+)